MVEIDENQHKQGGYNVDSEMERMRRISEEICEPMVFIRFNPDDFTVDKLEKYCDRFIVKRAVSYVPIEVRHEKLLERINHHLSISLEDRNRLETSRLLEIRRPRRSTDPQIRHIRQATTPQTRRHQITVRVARAHGHLK